MGVHDENYKALQGRQAEEDRRKQEQEARTKAEQQERERRDRAERDRQFSEQQAAEYRRRREEEQTAARRRADDEQDQINRRRQDEEVSRTREHRRNVTTSAGAQNQSAESRTHIPEAKTLQVPPEELKRRQDLEKRGLYWPSSEEYRARLCEERAGLYVTARRDAERMQGWIMVIGFSGIIVVGLILLLLWRFVF